MWQDKPRDILHQAAPTTSPGGIGWPLHGGTRRVESPAAAIPRRHQPVQSRGALPQASCGPQASPFTQHNARQAALPPAKSGRGQSPIAWTSQREHRRLPGRGPTGSGDGRWHGQRWNTISRLLVDSMLQPPTFHEIECSLTQNTSTT